MAKRKKGEMLRTSCEQKGEGEREEQKERGERKQRTKNRKNAENKSGKEAGEHNEQEGEKKNSLRVYKKSGVFFLEFFFMGPGGF